MYDNDLYYDERDFEENLDGYVPIDEDEDQEVDDEVEFETIPLPAAPKKA